MGLGMNCMLLLCVAAMLLCASCTSQSTQTVTDIPRIAGVDVRESPADWKGQGLVVRALAGENAILRPSTAFEVVGRLGWNEEGLLLQVNVTDSSPDESRDINTLYRGDSVELFLTTDDKTVGVAQVIASPGSDPSKARVKFFDYRNMTFKKDAAPVIPRAVSRRAEHGYVMDVLLPWSAMKIKPQVGTTARVRFCVNDLGGREIQRFGWINHQATGGWDDFPPVRLAEKPSAPSPIAVWGGYDEFKSCFVSAVAEPQLAGKTISVMQDGKVVGDAKLAMDGGRAMAQVILPFPELGKTMSDVAVQFDGKPIKSISFPDAVKARKDAFMAAASGPGRGFGPRSTLTPACKSTIFSGNEFPAFTCPDPERMNRLVGSFTIDTAYYNQQFDRVAKPTKPGRYGAITTVVAADGDSFTLYNTLYCLAPGASPTTKSAVFAAATAEAPAISQADADRLDRDWWHSLRKGLNTATRYEYFVHLPNGYGDDPAKRWPVIYYLHGSGRGEDANRARKDGPQGPATQRSDFPFIVVSLRSPGGWQPRAVYEVMDQVATACRTDTTRTYLCGFSMGAMGTWTIAQEQPHRFAAIAVVGGRKGDIARAGVLKGMGIWIINGADDTTTVSGDAKEMFDALQKAGVDAKYTEIPNAGHTDSDDVAYRWQELYDWMLQHHR